MWGMRANKASKEKTKREEGAGKRGENDYTNGEWRETINPEERKQEITDVKWQ